MEYQKISFPEAVKYVAEYYSIKIDLRENDYKSEMHTALYELHDIAMQLYQNNLFSKRE